MNINIQELIDNGEGVSLEFKRAKNILPGNLFETIYPFLFESDFVTGLLERVRKIIKINRPYHPWNELSNKDFFSTAGLFRRDLATGKEGFTLAALLLLGKDEVILKCNTSLQN